MAQEGAATEPEAAANSNDIIVTGTRRTDRSVLDSAVPVDVIGEKALASVSSSDLLDKLSQTVPSYTVQTRPLYGNQMFVRPVALRNLGADDTLVLVNGKRQHRSASVNFHVFGQASQAVDMSQIPAAALSRIEVLRNGASAQYGSDAIAGVVNVILKNKPGYSAYAQIGQYYEGDGLGFQAAANAGWNLGDRGNLNLTFEYTNNKKSSRTYQRYSALALAETGVPVKDPVTAWGDPAVELYRVALNGEYDVSDGATLYGFGLYGHSWGESNANWRAPSHASLGRSIFQNAPYNIFPAYDARSRFPAGFTALAQLVGEDVSLVGGLRGDLMDSITYDFSANWGYNLTTFLAKDSYNPSLGPLSPTQFNNGFIKSSELNLNADFVYQAEVGLPTPLNIAFGAQYRDERYKIGVGDPASYKIGPFSDLQAGSAATTLVLPESAGSWKRPSQAAYLDMDADLTERLNVAVAGRFEHYSDFGSTLNGKFASRFKFSEAVSIRGSVSTGFRAPTPGQIHAGNAQYIPDPLNPGQQQFQSLISVTDPIAVGFGAKPLKPSKSFDLSVGTVFDLGSGFNITIDYYNITVRDRLTSSQFFTAANGNKYNFFINAYKSRTTGVDLVATYQTVVDGGSFSITAAGNYNKTQILEFLPGALDAAQILYFERKVPNYSGVLTLDYSGKKVDITARARYYGSLVDIFFENLAWTQNVSPETFIDISASYKINSNVKLTIGADNILDNYPDKTTFGNTPSLDFGRVYPSSLPYSFNGGRYYGRVSVNF